MPVPTIEWQGGLPGFVRLVEQTRLPREFRYVEVRTPEEMWRRIKRLDVRGAPAIGIAAAFGLVLGIQGFEGGDRAEFDRAVEGTADYLATARPTAVNLFWALDRMRALCRRNPAAPVPEMKARLLEEARRILEEDRVICRRLGTHGQALLEDGEGALTHCNAGGLATADFGTALAVFFAARAAGKRFRVFADETRPLLQGARLTAWELMQEGIDVTLICDDMAGLVMKEGKVQKVFVGADRIAANGDAANKIGTYSLSILARAHGIPFYVVAPLSTFDLTIPDGAAIPIEQRDEREVTEVGGVPVAPEGVKVYNPAFDVTPAENITAIVTEHGVIEHPDRGAVERHCRAAGAA